MNKPARLCASCARFPLAQAVEQGGSALCGGYEDGRVVAFDDSPACPLYNRAADIAARRPLVVKLMQQKGKDNE